MSEQFRNPNKQKWKKENKSTPLAHRNMTCHFPCLVQIVGYEKK